MPDDDKQDRVARIAAAYRAIWPRFAERDRSTRAEEQIEQLHRAAFGLLSAERRIETSEDAVADCCRLLALSETAHRGLAAYRDARQLGAEQLRALAVNVLRWCPSGMPAARLDLALDIAEEADEPLASALHILLGRPELAVVHPRLRLAEARRCMAGGESEIAEGQLRETLKRFPCHGPTYRLLGDVLLSRRRADEAARAFDCAAACWNPAWWLIEFSARAATRVPGISVAGYEVFHLGEFFIAVKVGPQWRGLRDRWRRRYTALAIAIVQRRATGGGRIEQRLAALAGRMLRLIRAVAAFRRGPGVQAVRPHTRRWSRALRQAITRVELALLRRAGSLQAPGLPELLDLIDGLPADHHVAVAAGADEKRRHPPRPRLTLGRECVPAEGAGAAGHRTGQAARSGK